MTDLEKAIRYTCLIETKNNDIMTTRYRDIDAMVHGDIVMIEIKVKKYNEILDFLCKE